MTKKEQKLLLDRLRIATSELKKQTERIVVYAGNAAIPSDTTAPTRSTFIAELFYLALSIDDDIQTITRAMDSLTGNFE